MAPPQRFYSFDLGDTLVQYEFPDDWVNKARDLQEHLSNAPHDWQGYYDVWLVTDVEEVRERAFLRVTVESAEVFERTYDGDMSVRLAADPAVDEGAPLPDWPEAVFTSMVPYYVLDEYHDSSPASVRAAIYPDDRDHFDRVLEARRAEREE